jgi:hypothetical protein
MVIIAVLFGALMGVRYSVVTFSESDTRQSVSGGQVVSWFAIALSALAFPALLPIFSSSGTQSEKLAEAFVTAVASFCSLATIFLVALAVHYYRYHKKQRLS